MPGLLDLAFRFDERLVQTAQACRSMFRGRCSLLQLLLGVSAVSVGVFGVRDTFLNSRLCFTQFSFCGFQGRFTLLDGWRF